MRTYVIRVHEPRAGDPDPEELRGVADEVATGRRVTFTSGDELLALLADAGPSTAPAAHDGGHGDAID